MCRFVLFFPLLLIAACAAAKPEQDVDSWPPAGAGETRFVIRLPALDDESGRRVELRIGKDLEIDCNRHWFGGRLERGVVTGRGYPTYRLADVGGPASTMMACPEEQKRMAFVTVNLDDPFVRYDSSLPIVVYVPEGFTVRYRVWSADNVMQDAPAE